jgi:hypothetical protein
MAILSSPMSHAAESIGKYHACIGQQDPYRSKGGRLTQAWQVIRQDRANDHRSGIRQPGDENDGFVCHVTRNGWSIALAVMLLHASVIASADCHYIGMRGIDITYNPDLLTWDKVIPLIALEAGRFYSLGPERTMGVELHGGKARDLPGRFYYIPQHLIAGDGNFSLRIMLIDPDDTTPDDTLLPLTETPISLSAEKFSMDRQGVRVDYQPIWNAVHPSNPIHIDVEIRRRAGRCDQKSMEGILEDTERRGQNELKRLLDRVLNYTKPHLLGGREYRFYLKEKKVSAATYDLALAKALAIARANSRELIGLGRQIESLREIHGFERVWEEYRLLISQLASQAMSLEFQQDGHQQQARMPTLSLHPRWKDFWLSTEKTTLAKWSLALPEGLSPAAGTKP